MSRNKGVPFALYTSARLYPRDSVYVDHTAFLCCCKIAFNFLGIINSLYIFAYDDNDSRCTHSSNSILLFLLATSHSIHTAVQLLMLKLIFA